MAEAGHQRLHAGGDRGEARGARGPGDADLALATPMGWLSSAFHRDDYG